MDYHGTTIGHHQDRRKLFKCNLCGMKFSRKFNLHRHINRIHSSENAEDLRTAFNVAYPSKWIQLLHLEILKVNDVQYNLTMRVSRGLKRSMKFQIRRYEHGYHANSGVTFVSRDMEFLNSRLQGLEVKICHTTIITDCQVTIFKQNDIELLLPSEAMNNLKHYMPMIMEIVKYQRGNNNALAKDILRIVMIENLRDRSESAEHNDYLIPAIIIGS